MGYMRILSRLFFIGISLFLFLLISRQTVSAATLGSVSDTITTSRPSASAPLVFDQAAATQSATVVDNKSIYLASDSALFMPDTGETMTVGVNLASESASVNSQRVLYFTSNITNAHHKGDDVQVPITALHVIKFTTQSVIPVNGKITLTFPALTSGDANNAASPSATTFQMNGLASGQIKIASGTSDVSGNFTITVNNPSSGTSPTVVLSANTTTIAAGTVIKIFLGCSAIDANPNCTTQVPRIINPTKTATAGTADTWSINITTTDVSNAVDLDTGKAKIGTIESVSVSANIDPSFTFTIAGIADNTDLNSSSYCGASHEKDTTNTGISPTATDVNLGTVNSTASNSAAQLITIASNAVSGYSLTATSSGHFINPSSGSFLPNAQGDPTANDTPVPLSMTVGTPSYGITACDAGGKVATGTWGVNGDLRFANPSSAYLYTLVNSSAQPVSGGDKIVIIYRANVSTQTPAGIYRTVETYVATPIF